MKSVFSYTILASFVILFSLVACSSTGAAPTLNPTEGAQTLAGGYTTTITEADFSKIQSYDPDLPSNQGDWLISLTNDGQFNAEKDGQFIASGLFTASGNKLDVYVKSVCENCGCQDGIGRYVWALKGDQLTIAKTAGMCDGMDLVLTAHPLTRQP